MLDQLIERQRKLGDGNRAFALRLGVPYSTWRATRNGTRRVGKRVALAAMRTFPELAPLVVAFFMADDDTRGTRVA